MVEPGKPLRFVEPGESSPSAATGSESAKRVGETFKAYRDAAKVLLESKYTASKEYAPPHLRTVSATWIFRCSDGILVRYDPPGDVPPKVRVGEVSKTLTEMAPLISENVLHFAANPTTYVPPGGIQLSLRKHDGLTGAEQEITSLSLAFVCAPTLPSGFTIPPPPQRPIPLASILNEFELRLEGTIEPAEERSPRELSSEQGFTARGLITLPVGWRTIEVYPPLGDEHWRPEFAPLWAEVDILAAIAQRNLSDVAFRALDPRAETRKRYAALLGEYEALLHGPEEPVHQFLKQHPELLNQTFERCWSKLPFGQRISDFVFREPPGEYELVEIEAPIRELFRKDGQPREPLVHAINQTHDWIGYIADNKRKVEEEGLVGISTSPRTLVVIGRSASLTEENRRKLVTLQEREGRLRILTYDDLLAKARSNLERLFGPMGLVGQNVEVVYYPPRRPFGGAG